MHALAPVLYAILALDAEPTLISGGWFLLAVMAAVASPAVAHSLVLAVFAGHLVSVVTILNVGTAAPIVYAASAPLDQALGLSELSLVHRIIWALRALTLFGGVMETVFGRRRPLVVVNNAVCMALALWAPSSITVSYLMATFIVPAKLYIVIARRGTLGMVTRMAVGTAVFSALSEHEFAFEISTALLAALSL